MTRSHWIAVIALAAIAIAGVLVIGLRGATTTTSAAVVDDATGPFTPYPAPELGGTTLDGDEVSLADLRGGPVVVNFWATWCTPCRREIPALKAFAAAHPDVTMLGVNFQDDPEAARAFAAETGMPWPSIVDDGPLFRSYRAPGMPATFLIDADGRVVDRLYGEVTEAMLASRAGRLGVSR